jgi:hypothetical protein
MSELFIKTEEQKAKAETNPIFGGFMISIGVAWPAIYTIFGTRTQIYETNLNTFLFFGVMLLSACVGVLAVRQKEREARREDFYNREEIIFIENMEKEIKEIVELSDTNKPDIEQKITKLVLNKYGKELTSIRRKIMNEPLDEDGKYRKHILDLLARQKYNLFLLSLSMFSLLIYLIQ